MKIILVQLLVSFLAVQGSVIPIHTHNGITIIHAPPPGQSIAIQAPIVPASIALVPAPTTILGDIPPSSIPAAVSIAESPIRIPDQPQTIINSISSSIPAAVTVAESPITISQASHSGTLAIAGLSTATSIGENSVSQSSDDSISGGLEPVPVTEIPETDSTPEISTDHVESNNAEGTASSSVESNSETLTENIGTDIAGNPLVLDGIESSAVGSGAVITSPGIIYTPVPSPTLTIAHPAPVLLAAEGTYVAKTRGSEHIASLPGHINSASSINLEPAPGTI